MTALSSTSGLPLVVNTEVGILHIANEEVSCKSEQSIPLQDLSKLLLNRSLKYPQYVYHHYKSVKHVLDLPEWQHALNYDVMCLPAGLLGIEYIKSHVFKSDKSSGAAAIFQVLSGELTVVMQKNLPKLVSELYPKVQEVKTIVIQSPSKFCVPSGFFYSLVNTGEQPAVVARVNIDSTEGLASPEADYPGPAYYMISKNSLPQLVANPKYRFRPDPEQISVQDLNALSNYIPKEDSVLYQDAKINCPSLSALWA